MNWWATLYDDLLADVLLERPTPEEEARTVAFLGDVLSLTRSSVVFDQCSGIGSLAVPLAKQVGRVVGVDQAARYVERANARAKEEGAAAEFFTGDAFEFVPRERASAAFNWWTSFGYAPTDAENVRMLARAYESLEPGGAFALDSMNLAGVLRGFQGSVVTRRATARGEVVLVRETDVSLATGRMNKRWSFFVPGGETVVRTSSVRLYLPHVLGEMLASVGFVDPTFYGDLDRGPLVLDSPRCIVVGRKPR